MTAIGLFGGTFAPFHNGHLRLAIEAREALALDAIRLVPCALPPHRTPPAFTAEARLDWVRQAVAAERGLIVDDCELRRAAHDGRPSYTVETLEALRAEWPQASLVLLIGDDALSGLHGWHRWQALPELAHLVSVSRPDSPLTLHPDVAATLNPRATTEARDLHRASCGRWLRLDLPGLAISATRIRALLSTGRSVRGLVPDVLLPLLPRETARA